MIKVGKKLSFYAFLTAMVLFTGCSQKSVEVDVSGQEQGAGAASMQKGSESSLDRMERAGADSADMGAGEGGAQGMGMDAEGTTGLQNVYFDFDKYNLREDMVEVAKNNAAQLSSKEGKIKLEGNCDEWGTDEYNYALGLKRAKTAKDALIEDGIASSRIIMVSYGESNPVCTEHNIACWKKNRRVEYKLLP